MREAVGDLWASHAQGDIIVITTNLTRCSSGLAVMGRGCAKEAADRFPMLKRDLGAQIGRGAARVLWWPGYRLVTFPVKRHWRDPADLNLIERSARELLQLVRVHDWTQVVVPRPGCGAGQLDWDDVRPRLARIWDDRFVVMRHAHQR